jgi:hypothetical protein
MSVSEIYIENLAFVVMIKIVMAYSGDMTDITRSDMNYFLYLMILVYKMVTIYMA